jgi:predicted AAA+ superfamily ATPase
MSALNPDTLLRIAHALERLVPPALPEADPATGPHFRWDGARLHGVTAAMALPLDRYVGVDGQIAALSQNVGALKAGAAAHDMLLWGARGMGKSALVRSVAVQFGVALVQAAGDALGTLPALFARLAGVDRPFLLFVDDLAFAAADPGVRLLRSLLDGGIAERPANVRLAVTSNHRHLVEREAADSRHARDSADDQLALVDRFGLVLGFHAPDQATYLEMVRRHLAAEGLGFEAAGAAGADAIAFALGRGGRSGRTAWHYRTEVLARRTTSAPAATSGL